MRLHYGGPQTAIAIVFAVLALGLAALFAFVALQTRRDVPFERVRTSGYGIRRYWLGFLVVVLGAAVGISLVELPYSQGAAPPTVVRVSGGQFYWSASPSQVPAGTRVRFDVTSADVNHGMGLYDPDGQLIGSVQAMPGYHNRLDVTLRKAGLYRFSCLEFCGIYHHRMARTFRVTAS